MTLRSDLSTNVPRLHARDSVQFLFDTGTYIPRCYTYHCHRLSPRARARAHVIRTFNRDFGTKERIVVDFLKNLLYKIVLKKKRGAAGDFISRKTAH